MKYRNATTMDNPAGTIRLDNSKILSVETKWFERRVTEAIKIPDLKHSLITYGECLSEITS